MVTLRFSKSAYVESSPAYLILLFGIITGNKATVLTSLLVLSPDFTLRHHL